MQHKRYLVYRVQDGFCVNLIIWDGHSPYNLDEGLALEIVPAGSGAGVGWVRQAEGEWVLPPEEPQPVE